MMTQARLRHLRVAPRKVRLVADQIRGMKALAAIDELRVSAKHASRPLLKLLESAMANAMHNDNLTKETLRIKTITVDEGATLERFRPRAFGRAAAIRKRTSHVLLVLAGTPMSKKALLAKSVKSVKSAKPAPAAAKESKPAEPTEQPSESVKSNQQNTQ